MQPDEYRKHPVQVEFFSSPTAYASGFGEGQYFVGGVTIRMNNAGTVAAAPIRAVTEKFRRVV